jgi:ferredoxin-NADP reductase
MIDVRVAAIEPLSARVRILTLESHAGKLLPPFEPGSHVEVHLPRGTSWARSAYSLTGSPRLRETYQIVVRVRPESGHVSRWLHNDARPGSPLRITEPRCGLRLASRARRHLLIAGGVGVTAFLSHLRALREQGSDYHLYYTFRSREQGILAPCLIAEHGAHVTTCVSSEQGRLPLAQILRAQPQETHLYVCGPSGLMQAVFDGALQAGFGTHRIHWDRHGWSPEPRPAMNVLAAAGPAAVMTI